MNRNSDFVKHYVSFPLLMLLPGFCIYISFLDKAQKAAAIDNEFPSRDFEDQQK